MNVARQVATILLMASVASAAPPRPSKRTPDAPGHAPSAEAQQRFQRALDLYDEGNMDAARAELQRAYDIAPHYRLLYNLGQVAFELHDYPAALTAFEKYLAEGGTKIPEARRVQVESDIEKLKGRVARLALRVDAAHADVFVDDVAAGSTPLANPLVLGVGRRKIVVAKDGYATVTRWIEMAGGDSSELTVVLDPTSERVAASSASAPSTAVAVEGQFGLSGSSDAPRGPGPLWGGWAVAGSLAAVAVVTGSLAYVASRDLREQRSRLGVTREELDGKAVQVRNLSLATDIVGGASLVTAAVTLFATFSRKTPDGARAAGDRNEHRGQKPTFRVVPSLGLVQLSGTF
jgi:hypothetical protein